MPGKWICKLCKDRRKVCEEEGIGAKWPENTGCLWCGSDGDHCSLCHLYWSRGRGEKAGDEVILNQEPKDVETDI